MSYEIKQSSTAYPLVFLMVDSSDHITAKTGLSPTVTLSKAGGSFASPSGSVSEIGSGWYKVAGNATDSGTLGPLVLHATGTGADPVDVIYRVVKHDVQDGNLGLTGLTGLTAPTAGALPTVGSNSNQILLSNGYVSPAQAHTGTAQSGTGTTITLASGASSTDNIYNNMTIYLTGGTGAGQSAGITDYNGTTKAATIEHTWLTTPDNTTTYEIHRDRLGFDVANVSGKVIGGGSKSITGVGVWSRNEDNVKTAPASDVTAIKAKTDNLPSDPADASDIAAEFSTVNGSLATIAGYIDTEVAAIKAKTDNLPSSPAATGDAMTLTSAYDAAKTAAQAGDDMGIADGEITEAKFTLPTLSAHALATGPLGMIMQSWRADHYVEKFDSGTGDLKRYASDGTTVLLVLPCTDTLGVQTRGAAS